MPTAHTPSPAAKVFIIAFIFLNHNLITITKNNNNNNTALGNGDGKAQQLLFCCCFNILSLHIPSFIWNYKVNTSRSIALLEHILHYYFILAFILFLVKYHHPLISPLMEMTISTQMCMYFLWHIFHEIKLQELYFKKRCTLFPKVIETSISVFILCILPCYWSLIHGDELQNVCGETVHHDNAESYGRVVRNSFIYFSTLLLSEIASIFFQCFEAIYSAIMSYEDRKLKR
jgi:hypothetical protein